jgi:hypothetical protein
MPALRDLQSDMTSTILDAAAAERLAPRHLDSLAQPERLVLHARNFRAGLTAALASTFSGTQRLIGEGFFAFAAAQFLTAHPPRDPIVAQYGSDFPRFLSGLPALAKSPWVADVARLEWAIQSLSDIRPAPALETSALLHASDAHLDWSPSALLFTAPSPAADLLDPDGDLGALDLAHPCRLLLASTANGIAQHHLSVAAWAFLYALQAGLPLSAALEATAQTEFDPAATLSLAVRLGCFAAYQLT